ncbi:oligopeptide transport system permease protein [Scopulibacillus darangshiensis]|uniref:Oligopeptide transport system permease protein n=1 Tax=Scopulibacillus darangshiensis TaxID=442528 RepID=A0A4R2P4S9_9BACL|nr:ABC transporter permease [Scopulibacillus darangshiensis]TCP29753.1 oligopeptide transport system permease protein [Scopulibacillus darangshiensis]
MVRYIIGRIGYLIVTFFIIAALTFMLMQLLPGSPFNSEKLTNEQIEILKDQYHLNDPIAKQFINYIGGIFKGDLGVSFTYDGRPVTKLISERIGPSAVLGIESTIVGTILGLLLGIIAALRRNTYIDYISMIVAVLGISIPSFVFAGLLQYFVGVKWALLPVAFWEGPLYHVMPVISLAVGVMATIARFMRTEMLEVLGQDYMTTAKAKGLSSVTVVFKHAIRNALIPVITILGPLVIGLVTGTLVIEHIFAVPGLGDQFVDSISKRDYPMIMGTTLLYSALFLIIILVVDLLYGIIDPRIRLASGGKD